MLFGKRASAAQIGITATAGRAGDGHWYALHLSQLLLGVVLVAACTPAGDKAAIGASKRPTAGLDAVMARSPIVKRM